MKEIDQLTPGYYWYTERSGTAPVLVRIYANEVHSTEWGRYYFLPTAEKASSDPSEYACGTYAGPIPVPVDLENCGLPLRTVCDDR